MSLMRTQIPELKREAFTEELSEQSSAHPLCPGSQRISLARAKDTCITVFVYSSLAVLQCLFSFFSFTVY